LSLFRPQPQGNKTYFKNGKMESEWLNQNQKSRLLVLLFENGNKRRRALMRRIKKLNGGFYRTNKEIEKKSEFEKSIEWLFFNLQKIVSLEPKNMHQQKKIKEWNSLSEFKRQ
jgi:hypothetical protein